MATERDTDGVTDGEPDAVAWEEGAGPTLDGGLPVLPPPQLTPTMAVAPPAPGVTRTSVQGIIEIHRTTNEMLRDRRGAAASAQRAVMIRWMILFVLAIAALAVVVGVALGARALIESIAGGDAAAATLLGAAVGVIA